MVRRVSKSFLSCYTKCPRQSWYQFVEERPWTTTPAMERGTEFHDAAENLFKVADIAEMEGKSYDEIYEYLRQFFPEGSHYDYFVRFETERYLGLEDKNLWYPVETERYILNKKESISGIIDRIDMLEPGTYYSYTGKEIVLTEKTPLIVEYKTGKYRKQVNDELAYYSYLKGYGKYTLYGACLFVDAEKIYFNKLQMRTVDKIAKQIGQLKMSIKDNSFPKNVSFWCDWCSFTEECLLEETEVI